MSVNLLALYLLFFPCSLSLVPVGQLPKPDIAHLDTINAGQTLLVSWLVTCRSMLGETYEVQIGRTENHTITHSRNISVLNLGNHSWTWTSDLPLECVDHSVRIRYFYNQTVPSPWSDWRTNSGARPTSRTQIFPFQRVLREGDSAVFCCVPPPGVHVTGITLNNENHPLIDLGSAVRAISVANLTIPTTSIKPISIGCIEEGGRRNWPVWNYVSFPPQKPRNLSCVTSDLTTVTCSWDPGRKRDPHDRNKQTTTLHFQNLGLSPVNCQPGGSSCSFQVVPHLEEYNISVVVKDQLGEEAESYCFRIRDRVVPVVRWSRLIPGVTTTGLSWTIQGNLTTQTLLCQVITDPSSSSEPSCDPTRRICEVQLKRLSPGCQYSVMARCSVTGRLWGPWTKPLSFKTYPMVTLDLWRRIKQLSDPVSRQLTLLWKPRVTGSSPEPLVRGYAVEWSQEGETWSGWRGGGETRVEFHIGPGRYEVAVSAVLHAGPNVSAHMTIPGREDAGGEPPQVVKRLYGAAAAALNLSWEKQETATCGYTVEWCILGDRDPCVLRWMEAPAGSSTLSLPTGDFEAGRRLRFNIYGCTENGHKLLEIQTGYTQELQSVEAPSLVRFTSKSSSVTLEWSYNEDDQDHPAFIIGYLVTVQEDTLADLLNVSVSDPRRKSVTVGGLQPDREYTFSLSALTRQGPGQDTSITIRTRPKYSTHLAAVLAPVVLLLLLCCTVLLWPRRKAVKTRLVGVFSYPAGMNIRAPDLDSFLQEMAKKLESQEADECKECRIEVLNARRFPDGPAETDPLASVTCVRSPPSEASLAHIPTRADYCPQSAPVLNRGAAHRPATPPSARGYFSQQRADLCEVADAGRGQTFGP